MVIDTILLNGAAGFVVGGAWVAKALWSSHNGNGKLSKDDHRDLCAPVKLRLDTGEQQFRDIIKKIDENHKETMHFILELTTKVSAR
jgi:hypothetical protein